MSTLLSELSDQPAHFSDCCPALSTPLINTLAQRLPPSPALTLSVGCGSGRLEALLLQTSPLDLYGVEVPLTVNRHLPEQRMLRVSSTASTHPDAMSTSSLLFVYPRQPALIASYIDASLDGSLESIVWLGHKNDYHDYAPLLQTSFHTVELIEGPGIPPYELLVIASIPKAPPT